MFICCSIIIIIGKEGLCGEAAVQDCRGKKYGNLELLSEVLANKAVDKAEMVEKHFS